MVKIYRLGHSYPRYFRLDHTIYLYNKIKVEAWEYEGRYGYFPPGTWLRRNSYISFVNGELRIL